MFLTLLQNRGSVNPTIALGATEAADTASFSLAGPTEETGNTPGFLHNVPQFAPSRRREREELEIVERIAAAAPADAQAVAPQTTLADLEAALAQLETQAARTLAMQQIALLQAQLAIEQARERARQDDEAMALIIMTIAMRR